MESSAGSWSSSTLFQSWLSFSPVGAAATSPRPRHNSLAWRLLTRLWWASPRWVVTLEIEAEILRLRRWAPALPPQLSLPPSSLCSRSWVESKRQHSRAFHRAQTKISWPSVPSSRTNRQKLSATTLSFLASNVVIVSAGAAAEDLVCRRRYDMWLSRRLL